MTNINCTGDKEKPAAITATEMSVAIGGRPAVSLSRPEPQDKSRPQFVSAEILPGRGMNTYQLRAWLPGRGVTDLFTAPSLAEAARLMNNGPLDQHGNQSFTVGGAILVPYANRIRGNLSPDGKTLETILAGKKITLPANWQGKNPGAEKHAMHGLILASAMDNVSLHSGDAASVTGTLDAGDFQGFWPSQTELTIKATLTGSDFGFTVTARNAGNEPLPIGIGWHPYFNLPSGSRSQARLSLPASERALVDNYDNVFPTGKLVTVKGTEYDVAAPGGIQLKQLFLDDCFVGLSRTPEGHAVAQIVDPAAKYGIRIRAVSPQVKAFQVYAPVEKSFIALEPQFNWADPYSKLWPKGTDTGMVLLQPGESVTYEVKLELFTPAE